MTRVTFEEGCYYGKDVQCGSCNKIINQGDSFVQIDVGSWFRPFVHADCLLNVAQFAKAEEVHRDTYKQEWEQQQTRVAATKAAKKAEAIVRKKKADFNKQLIKDAMKSADLVIRKSRINRIWSEDPDRFRIFYAGCTCQECSRHVKVCDISILQNHVALDRDPLNKDLSIRGTLREEYDLTDPNSISKIGLKLKEWLI